MAIIERSVVIMYKTPDGWTRGFVLPERDFISSAAFTSDQNHCLIISKNRCDIVGRDGLDASWALKFSHQSNLLRHALMIPETKQVLAISEREVMTPFAVVKENAKLSLIEPTKLDETQRTEHTDNPWRANAPLFQEHSTLGTDDGQSIYTKSHDGNHIVVQTNNNVNIFSRQEEQKRWALAGEYRAPGRIQNVSFLPGVNTRVASTFASQQVKPTVNRVTTEPILQS